MPHRKSKNMFGLMARRETLLGMRDRLEHSIADEHRRPLPDLSRLSKLKRLKLRAKDEAASIEAVLRTLGHGHQQRAS
ncbi:DUF465 domain-containing protein [Actibacterium sp. 188UL27-1]|uniref:DUF465 domain-containing protein n=1 Tax=Actibacterium sp. 188UL27-1 TaxID=2786961 RepID=UPI00195E391C|nr:DUF465 domain-containing protein [Actibacterium sp. 188UL27-1]MBM7066824.1 DUF465 domain-containing protein [Actibacterium sp. 188UL27-1]